MANIELSYSDDTDLPEVDRAILKALTARGRQLVVELTYVDTEPELGGTINLATVTRDVVLIKLHALRDLLCIREFSELHDGPVGPQIDVPLFNVHKIKVY